MVLCSLLQKDRMVVSAHPLTSPSQYTPTPPEKGAERQTALGLGRSTEEIFGEGEYAVQSRQSTNSLFFAVVTMTQFCLPSHPKAEFLMSCQQVIECLMVTI